jgi:hypothetical protein
MTTLPDLWTKIGDIQDVEALRLVHRLVRSEMTIVEAQLAQLQQVDRAIEEKMKEMEDLAGNKGSKTSKKK